MIKLKYWLPLLIVAQTACVQLKEEDDMDELAAAELNKLALYQSETTAVPGELPALPSPYLEPGENLLLNGSFELPVLDSPWSLLATGAVPGWQASWVDQSCTSVPLIELQSKNLFNIAAEFDQYAELDTNSACSSDARIRLTQKFVTQPNHIYRLTFRVRARDAEHTMGLRVNLGDNFVHEVNPPADKWIALTLHFEATGNETTLAFSETGDGDTYGTFLDAVEVREVTVDTERMPKPEKGKKKMRGKKRHSFDGGRRHKDCQSMRHKP